MLRAKLGANFSRMVKFCMHGRKAISVKVDGVGWNLVVESFHKTQANRPALKTDSFREVGASCTLCNLGQYGGGSASFQWCCFFVWP